MALLLNQAQKRRISLPSRALVGRGASATLRLADPLVSGEHASIWWDGSDWCVKDLASRNGTYVDGARLDAGQVRALDSGSIVGFGKKDGWTVSDIRPPLARATAPGGAFVEEVDGFICLPNDEDPLAILFRDPHGQWLVDEDGTTRPVAGSEVTVDGRLYTLDLPRAHVATLDASRGGSAADIGFRFAVSLDEEHVQVDVRMGSTWQRLKPRAHHYLLLTMARLRLQDEDAGPEQCGWTHAEDLCKMVGLRTGLLNMQVLRIRRELEGLGVHGAADIIERRPLACTLRLAIPEVEVKTLQ